MGAKISKRGSDGCFKKNRSSRHMHYLASPGDAVYFSVGISLLWPLSGCGYFACIIFRERERERGIRSFNVCSVDRSITIRSDSQTALKSTSTAKTTSGLVWETMTKSLSLSVHNCVQLCPIIHSSWSNCYGLWDTVTSKEMKLRTVY